MVGKTEVRKVSTRLDYHGCTCVRELWLLVAMAILFTTLQANTTSDGGDDFAPGGTRIVPYNWAIPNCQRLKMSDGSSKYPAYLFLLRDKPRLTGHDNFTINSTRSLGSEHYVYWKYYLYTGSNFSMNACVETSATKGFYFYIIRNESNFKSWVDNHDPKYTIDQVNISVCKQPQQVMTSSRSPSPAASSRYRVTTTQEYFFVFYNPWSKVSLIKYTLVASMKIERTLYIVSSSSEIVDGCQVDPGSAQSNSGSCSVDVSNGSNYTALVIVGTPPLTNYTDSVPIDWDCDAGGSGGTNTAIPVLCIVCILVGIVVLCLIVAAFYYCLKHPDPHLPRCTWLKRWLNGEKLNIQSKFTFPRLSLNSDHKDSTALPHRHGYGAIQPIPEKASGRGYGAIQPIPEEGSRRGYGAIQPIPEEGSRQGYGAIQPIPEKASGRGYGAIQPIPEEARDISDGVNPLRPPHQRVLDPAPMDRKHDLELSSESAVIAGAAALL